MTALSNHAGHLSPKQVETHGCILRTVVTDAQVLNYQAISTHSAHLIFIVRNYFDTELLVMGSILENEITFWKKITRLFKD